MTDPTVLDGHEFTCDRRPYDDPIWILTWRRRWSCNCGASGWQAGDPEPAYRGWRKHVKNLRERANRQAPSGVPTFSAARSSD